MTLKRRIVLLGEKFVDYVSNDIQSNYYKRFFTSQIKQAIKHHKIKNNKAVAKKAKEWWKDTFDIKIKPYWHIFYSEITGKEDVKYIPSNIYYSIIEPYYNNRTFAPAIDDKCYYDKRFDKVNHTKCIVKNIAGFYYDANYQIISKERAVATCLNEKNFVVKPSIASAGGNRLTFITEKDSMPTTQLSKIFENYGKNFTVEIIAKECEELKALNPTSLNTIRLMTFLDQDGVHVLSSVMRMGGKDSKTDNFSTGGIACGILPDGTLKDIAYDQAYYKHTTHPNGTAFAGKTIPHYENIIKAAKAQHLSYGHFRLISWDFYLDEEYNPTLIEFNFTPQGIDVHNLCNGGLFGDLTEKIVTEALNGKNKKR